MKEITKENFLKLYKNKSFKKGYYIISYDKATPKKIYRIRQIIKQEDNEVWLKFIYSSNENEGDTRMNINWGYGLYNFYIYNKKEFEKTKPRLIAEML